MTELTINWQAKICKIFGDLMTEDDASAWKEAKRAYPIGTMVSGSVKLKSPFGLWLDVGIRFPALLLVTRLERSCSATDFSERGPKIGDEVTATVYLHNDEDRQLVLTQKPLALTI